MAAILPTSVEFHNHQVVAAFHIKIVKNAYKKKSFLLVVTSAINSKGSHAIKMKKVKGETGQDIHSNKPDNILRPSSSNFFKLIVLRSERS